MAGTMRRVTSSVAFLAVVASLAAITNAGGPCSFSLLSCGPIRAPVSCSIDFYVFSVFTAPDFECCSVMDCNRVWLVLARSGWRGSLFAGR